MAASAGQAQDGALVGRTGIAARVRARVRHAAPLRARPLRSSSCGRRRTHEASGPRATRLTCGVGCPAARCAPSATARHAPARPKARPTAPSVAAAPSTPDDADGGAVALPLLRAVSSALKPRGWTARQTG
eukprot:6703271-Prymnesium_polylepis.2